MVRENSGKNQTKNLERIASQLAKRMEIARTKWFDACIEGIRMMAKVSKWSQEVDSALKRNTDSMIKSFQLVHALSFINMKGYLSSSEMGPFNNILCDYICGAELDKCLPSINRYTELKKERRGEHFNEQFLLFSEDIALSIAQDLLLATVVDTTVLDFDLRNLCLAAEVFGDNETYNELLDSINEDT